MTRARNSANLASHGNLFVDITNDRTGIGSVVPDQNLHVAGTAGFHADVTFTGDLYNTTWDRSANTLQFTNNSILKLGQGSYATTIVNNINTTIDHSPISAVFLKTNDLQVIGSGNRSGTTYDNGILRARTGIVELGHEIGNGGASGYKLATAAYGVNVTGTTDTDGLIVSGVATVTTMNVTGVLTYDDVTSVDSVGIVTARQGVRVTADGSDSSNYISVGAGDDLKLYHSGSHSFIDDTGTGNLYIQSNHVNIDSKNGEQFINCVQDGAVELYHDNNLRVQTDTSSTIFRGGAGIRVYGDAGSNQNGQISIHPTGTAVYSNLFFYNAAGNSYASIVGHAGGTLFFTGGTNGPLRFRVNGSGHHSFQDGNTEKVRITVGGTVNIGGDFTNTTGKLKVTGTSRFTDEIIAEGVISVQSGGSINIPDKLIHSGDTDTNLNFHDVDKFRIELGGITSAFSGLKSTSGAPHAKWGINVATPQAALHIDEAYNHQGVLRVTNGNQNSSYYHQLEMSGTNNIYTLWKHYDGTNNYNSHAHGSTGHFWYISGQEKLRIDSSGRVGIGTDNPTATLDVSPTIQVKNTAFNGAANVDINAANGGQARLNLYAGVSGGVTRASRIDFHNQGVAQWMLINDHTQNGTNYFSIRHGSKVAIQCNPDSTVSLYDDNDESLRTDAAGILVPEKVMHLGDTDTYLSFGTNTINLHAGGNDRFLIASDGQNTIKSGAHDKGLDILPVGNSQETRLRLQAKNSSGTAHTFTLGAKQSGNRMDIYGTGPICFLTNPVGIHNTAPESPLHVGSDTNPHTTKATLFVGPSSGDGQVHIRGGSPTLYFDSTGGGSGKILMDASDLVMKSGSIDANGTELFRFTAGGRIGIGTGAPVNGIDIRDEGINVYSTGGSVRYQLAVNSSNGVDLTSKNTSGSYNTYQINAGTFRVRTTGTNSPADRFTIDGNGNIQHNSAGSGISYFKGSSEYVFGSNSSSPSAGGPEGKFQIHDHKTRVTLSINGYMNNAGAPILQLMSSRSGTLGTLGTKAAMNDYHGDIRFMGDNGTNNNSLVQSAQILVRQKSTISDGDTVCAGEMSFYTGTDSAGSILERLRIDSGGRLTLLNSEGIKLSAKTSTLYAQDGSLSYYASNNAVYLNGAGASGWLRLNAAGTANNTTAMNLYGGSYGFGSGGQIDFRTNSTERMRIDSNGHVNIMGAAGTTAGNLHVGVDGATGNFTDSGNGNTKHIEIGATSGGDALLTTHASGYGVAYFGYEAGGDRCIIACDDGGGANKIDFVTNAGTSTGGSSDNLNGKHPKMRIKSGGGGVEIFVHQSATDFQPKHDVTALLIQNGIGGGDIGSTSEPTHIDWAWQDSNPNDRPQCRISGNVGNGGDPNSLQLEGKGFLTFHCSDTNSSSYNDIDPPQRLRIAHNGTFTGSSSNNISDQRLKENIATITDPIAKIKALKGRTFTWKSEASMREGTHYGFIAQEVESIIPDLIVDDTGIRVFDKDDNLQPSNVITPPVGGGYAKSVDADGVTPVLVEALKEALAKIEVLEAKVAALEG